VQRFRGAEQLERFSRGGGSCAVDFCAVRGRGSAGDSVDKVAQRCRCRCRGGAEMEQRWSRGGADEVVQRFSKGGFVQVILQAQRFYRNIQQQC